MEVGAIKKNIRERLTKDKYFVVLNEALKNIV